VHIRSFEWDDWNVHHIARHGIEPHEAEAVCRGTTVILRGRGGSYLAYGRTAEDRYLLVVFRAKGGGVVRIITARDMTMGEQQLYHRRR